MIKSKCLWRQCAHSAEKTAENRSKPLTGCLNTPISSNGKRFLCSKSCFVLLLGPGFVHSRTGNCRERWKSRFDSPRNRSPHGAYFVIRLWKQLPVARKRFLWAHPKRKISVPGHLFPGTCTLRYKHLGWPQWAQPWFPDPATEMGSCVWKVTWCLLMVGDGLRGF